MPFMDEFKTGLSILATVLSVGAVFYAWLTAKSRVNSEHLKRVDDTLKVNDRRIQKLENEIAHMPGKDEVHGVQVSITAMEGMIGRMEEKVVAVERTVLRIDDYLMNKGDK